jgi:ClpP class serine protease
MLNKDETCLNPACEYVASCQFATKGATESDKRNVPSLRIHKNGLAVLPVVGSVDLGLKKEAQSLQDRLGEYSGVLVYISSSGGYSGSASHVMRILREVGEEIPVVAYIDYAASAALEIALACPEVYAEKDAGIGGLGTHSFNCFEGKKPVSVTSTLTTKKNIDLSHGPDVYDPKPYSSKIEDEIQALCDSIFLRIFRSISASRGVNIDRLHPLLDGSVLDGAAFVKMGLVDGVLEPEAALKILGNNIKMKRRKKESPQPFV